MADDRGRSLAHLISEQLKQYPVLFDRLHHLITPQRAFAVFQAIADTYAPTLTVRYTRTPVVAQLLNHFRQEGLCGANLSFQPNYLASGNAALIFGKANRKPVWSMAHLDTISFLTGAYQAGRYHLTPYCMPRQTPGSRPALALNYSLSTHRLETVAEGWLQSEEQGHFFACEVADLPPATRVVYATRAEWDQTSGMVYGTIDDAFGAAAVILAGIALSHYELEAMIVLTDEEEGVVGSGPQAFARGSMRLLQRIAPEQVPDLITISDVQEDVAAVQAGRLDQAGFGAGARFAGFASNTMGGVTPPQLLAFQRQLADYLATEGILLKENSSYVSRSDCVSAMMATPNVALIGFPGAYSHFIDTPRAHINDLVHLAKSLAVYLLIAQDEAWRAVYLGL